MNQQVFDVPSLIIHSRCSMEKRQWATFFAGGVAAWDEKIGKIAYIPSNATLRIMDEYPVEHVPINNATDDLGAGLWAHGFQVLEAKAIARTMSLKALKVAQTIPVDGIKITDAYVVENMGKTGEFKLPVIKGGTGFERRMAEVAADESWGKPSAFLVNGVGLFVMADTVGEAMIRCEALELFFNFHN